MTTSVPCSWPSRVSSGSVRALPRAGRPPHGGRRRAGCGPADRPSTGRAVHRQRRPASPSSPERWTSRVPRRARSGSGGPGCPISCRTWAASASATNEPHRPRHAQPRDQPGDRRQVGDLRPAEHLARVEQAGRVERVLDRAVHLEGDRADLALEPVDLDRAHAVLAGDRAAQGEPEFEDVVERAKARVR